VTRSTNANKCIHTRFHHDRERFPLDLILLRASISFGGCSASRIILVAGWMLVKRLGDVIEQVWTTAGISLWFFDEFSRREINRHDRRDRN